MKKKSLWPLGIILASGCYVGGVAFCSILACTHKPELVAKNYYDQEIKYQSHIDSMGREHQLATRATALYDDVTKSITVSLPGEHVGKNITGEIGLYRPSASGEDQQIQFNPDATGRQLVPASTLAQGLWTIRISWRVDGKDYFFDKKIAIGSAEMQAKLAALNKRTPSRN